MAAASTIPFQRDYNEFWQILYSKNECLIQIDSNFQHNLNKTCMTFKFGCIMNQNI